MESELLEVLAPVLPRLLRVLWLVPSPLCLLPFIAEKGLHQIKRSPLWLHVGISWGNY